MKQLEKLIKSKIVTFSTNRHNCETEFNNFKTIEKGIHGKVSGYIKLKKSDEPVWYDSTFELKVLKDLDKCSFVKKIKTQSLSIIYNKKSKHPRIYIPDIQLLLIDNSIVVIEIKPYKDMVNSRNLKKYKILRKFSKEKGYGFAYIDQDYYSFEDLKIIQLDDVINNEFLAFVEKRERLSFADCNEFKEKYRINDYHICYLIWKNRRKIKYQQYYISYKRKK